MTALPVSWDVEGKLFSGTKLLCYLCVWAVSSKPKSPLSISPKTKTKNFPGPRAGGLQIATRKNWMDEQITPEYSYCKWKQGMGQGWGERKGKKTYQSHICHWLNGKGDYKDIFVVWNDISETWRILHGGWEPLSSCSSPFFRNLSIARAEKFNAVFLGVSWWLDPKPLENVESHLRH